MPPSMFLAVKGHFCGTRGGGLWRPARQEGHSPPPSPGCSWTLPLLAGRWFPRCSSAWTNGPHLGRERLELGSQSSEEGCHPLPWVTPRDPLPTGLESPENSLPWVTHENPLPGVTLRTLSQHLSTLPGSTDSGRTHRRESEFRKALGLPSWECGAGAAFWPRL